MRKLILGTLALAVCGCGDSQPPTIPASMTAPIQPPEEHAPAPDTMVRWSTGDREPVSDPFPDWPPRLRNPTMRGSAEAPVKTDKEPTATVDPMEQVTDAMDGEIVRWLADANAIQPGCLLTHRVPAIWLPPPETIQRLLTALPEDFGGIAREALICRLGLSRLTRAQLFGSTAFLPAVAAQRMHVVGGGRAQGVLVLGLRTEAPRGEGTAVLILDERSSDWHVRSGQWIDWPYDGTERRIVALNDARVVDPRRKAIWIRQQSTGMARTQIIAMTPTDQLAVLLDEATVDATFTQELVVRAPGWPRAIVGRGWDAQNKRWRLRRWETTHFAPYEQTVESEGGLSLDDVDSALDAGFSKDIRWLVHRFPRAVRKQADFLALQARAADAGGQHKRAVRLWKKALRATDANPAHGRDFALYWVERKKPSKAIPLLKKYLETVPEAADHAAIQILLTDIEAMP